MEETNLEENKNLKKNWFSRSNSEKAFFALVILFSLYGFYPLFVMQVKFLFVPDYPDREVFYEDSHGQYDFIFKKASAIIDGPGKVCFINPGKGIAYGTFSGKANYYIYPNRVQTFSPQGDIKISDIMQCDYLMAIALEEIRAEGISIFDNIQFLQNKYKYISDAYSLLIYERR